MMIYMIDYKNGKKEIRDPEVENINERVLFKRYNIKWINLNAAGTRVEV